MRPGWTAGVTRGRLLLTRAIGAEHAAAIAACTSLGEAGLEADRVLARGRERTPALVADVVRCVLEASG